MAQDQRIGVLENLTPLQARFLLNLYLYRAAIEQEDVERVIFGEIFIMETAVAMTTEERQDLVGRINLLHRAVGCSVECSHTAETDANPN